MWQLPGPARASLGRCGAFLSLLHSALISPIACCRSALDIKDVPVGAGRQQYMHTITAGNASNPPMVLLPGYGAGAGFYFRCHMYFTASGPHT